LNLNKFTSFSLFNYEVCKNNLLIIIQIIRKRKK